LKAEAEKFEEIFELVKREPKCKNIKGVLIMMASCEYSVDVGLGNSESIIWVQEGFNFEILIMNLGTKNLRRKFFNLAISGQNLPSDGAAFRAITDSQAQISETIEKLINYRYHQD